MSYTSLAFVFCGAVMMLVPGLRLRTTFAEGLHEYYGGRACKISRLEQPRSYWAHLTLMVSACAAGAALLYHGTALTHL